MTFTQHTNLPKPQFSHWLKRDNTITYPEGCCEDKMNNFYYVGGQAPHFWRGSRTRFLSFLFLISQKCEVRSLHKGCDGSTEAEGQISKPNVAFPGSTFKVGLYVNKYTRLLNLLPRPRIGF